MANLFHQLGVDWKLLLSQAVNFMILLFVLTRFVYRPLLKIMKERREVIEKGLKGAEEARARLQEIESERTTRLAVADRKAVEIIAGAEKDAGARASEIVELAEGRAAEIIEEGARITEQRREEAFEKFRGQAGILIREAIAKAVSENPRAVDEKLVGQAVAVLQEKKSL